MAIDSSTRAGEFENMLTSFASGADRLGCGVNIRAADDWGRVRILIQQLVLAAFTRPLHRSSTLRLD
jgi:hypothetical protein